MQTLATHFRKDQFNFSQVKRTGDVALFQKSKPSGYVGFEVVLVQQTPERIFPGGHTVPEHESMPGSETWGRFGWTYSTIAAANSKFDALTV